MTDAAATDHHERLRDAAIRVLNAAETVLHTRKIIESHPEQLSGALEGLRRVLRDDPPPAGAPRPARPAWPSAPWPSSPDADTRHLNLDPARHFLSGLHYVGKQAYPRMLELEAAGIRQELARDSGTVVKSYDPDDHVRLTHLRAMIIATLLRELASRLWPGMAFGSSRHGEELAAVAEDLAWELLDQTILGRA